MLATSNKDSARELVGEHSGEVQVQVRPDPEEMQRMVEEAHKSFTQPSWAVHLAGVIIALCGGMINAISYLDLGSRTFVSHLTGTSTKVGMRAAGLGITPSEAQKAEDAEEAASFAYAVLLVVFFVSGSCLCGMLISRNAVSIGRSAYGLVLLITSSLLTVAAFSDISAGKPIGALAAAMACGVINGMTSTYSGNIVRTTHVTGTWTDCGVSLGRVTSNLLRNGLVSRNLNSVNLAYLKADFSRCRLMFMLALGFITGAFLGAFIHRYEPLGVKRGLLIPATILAVGGIGHAFYVSFVLHIGFWQMLQTSSQNPQTRQALLCVDGEVYDISGADGVLSFDSNKRPQELNSGIGQDLETTPTTV